MGKFLILIVSVLIILAGCSNSKANGTAEGTKELVLAHNQPTNHPVHKSLVDFKERLEKKSNGRLKLKIYANGQLGSEREVIEMTQTNAIQFTKVSASALESFSESYSLFSMPYLFKSPKSYRAIMKKPEIQKAFFNTTEDNGFIGITYYDAGVRNMYTKDRIIKTNADMKGLKTRVQPSKTSVQMIDALGGTPTPMSFSEVYTALQSGIIDAAENNETALTDNKHGEVAKHYFYTEHAMVPDILIMNKDAYDQLTNQEKKWLKEAAEESTVSHEKRWDKQVKKAIETAKEDMDVEFHEVNKASFLKAVKPLQEQFKNNKETKEQYELIKEVEKNEQNKKFNR
ncbi:TRAP transporter substrate-binding protein [Priestia endophytica]|uniref:TRAP transporter substrate-binding protein DctP n=1 Tax=Priestia endophytica TaxID=135735 RepID=A0AAX1QC98_9BACI|nr:TRAP transporter substrate-binding protein [Priestia endophytica]RAS78688.1 TRAP transporter substrate-binding protein DctP [Priestia endophytica]RAS85449.1 TRAP transporter substrate-binding protein DctP [Priestia endophytica]